MFKYWSKKISEIVGKSCIVEPCKNPLHGDIASNVILTLKENKEEIKEKLLKFLNEQPEIEKVDIVGPGFLNITFTKEYIKSFLDVKKLLDIKTDHPQKILIEYVSANPTGPLHIGHGRNAVFGDVLAKLLRYVGNDVETEYYVNDAGNQVNNLGRSVYVRYLELLEGSTAEFTADMYKGEYLIPVAEQFVNEFGDQYVGKIDDPHVLELFKSYAVKIMVKNIASDLADIHITFDRFVSEEKLIEEHKVDLALQILTDRGYLYEGVLDKPEEHEGEWEGRSQTIFRSTEFGDDKDRALIKEDASYTYFASDIAYHYDKCKRGYDQLINVFGADHSGYITRIKAATEALSNKKDLLNIKVCQLVNFLENGKPFVMSKRAGTFVTLKDVVDHIGSDAFRYMLITRHCDIGFDFDFQLVKEKSKNNPVFYVQYAFARIASVKRRFLVILADAGIQNTMDSCLRRNDKSAKDDTNLLTDEQEFSIIKLMIQWKRLVELAAMHLEPHRITNYLYDLAHALHNLWSKSDYKILDETNIPLTTARINLLNHVQIIIKEGLDILGVGAYDEM